MLKPCFFILFLIGIQASLFSQDKKKVGILPVPAFGHSPETNTYVGAVTLFTFDIYNDSLTRISNVDFEFNYTWNKQIILESTWNYYFREESWYTQGKIHYSKYPDVYYGIGANTLKSQEVLFDSRRTIVDVNLFKHLDKKIFVGLGLTYQNYRDVENSDSAIHYPELTNQSVLGPGFLLLKDTRNNILNSTSGTYFLIDLGYYFSENRYSKLIFDLRNYHTIHQKYILAWRFYNSFIPGSPAFFDYSLIGGDNAIRGFRTGRYRDKNMSFVQVETRLPLFWRFGIAVFGGVTGIYSSFNTLDQNTIKSNLGLGLRFLIDKKENINLRFDYAIGSKGHDGFYVAFGESF